MNSIAPNCRMPERRRRAEWGVTLIELLVVVTVLALMAAVVVSNLGKFIGKGSVEAANTETHSVLAAVFAYLSDQSLSSFTGSVGPSTSSGVEPYLIGTPLGLQATYDFVDTELVSATPRSGGKWTSLTYTPGTGWHD